MISRACQKTLRSMADRSQFLLGGWASFWIRAYAPSYGAFDGTSNGNPKSSWLAAKSSHHSVIVHHFYLSDGWDNFRLQAPRCPLPSQHILAINHFDNSWGIQLWYQVAVELTHLPSNLSAATIFFSSSPFCILKHLFSNLSPFQALGMIEKEDSRRNSSVEAWNTLLAADN